MTVIQGVIMSNSLSKTTAYVQVIQNDQQAINAAYQVADFALEVVIHVINNAYYRMSKSKALAKKA